MVVGYHHFRKHPYRFITHFLWLDSELNCWPEGFDGCLFQVAGGNLDKLSLGVEDILNPCIIIMTSDQ